MNIRYLYKERTVIFVMLLGLGCGEPGVKPPEAADSVTIYEDHGILYLRINGRVHSAIDTDNEDRLLHVYARLQSFAILAHPAIAARRSIDMLSIGLGGGVINKHLYKNYPFIRQVTVEIDAAVAQHARTTFGLPAAVKIVIAEGRAFLAGHRKKYDVLLLDAFDDHGIPFPLKTIEFIGLVKAHLKRGGIVIADTALGSRTRWQEEGTYLKLFRRVFEIRERTGGNRVLIAGSLPGAGALKSRMKKAYSRFKPKYMKFAELIEDLSEIRREERHIVLRDADRAKYEEK